VIVFVKLTKTIFVNFLKKYFPEKIIFCFAIFFIFFNPLFSQKNDSILIHQLLQNIAAAQVSNDGEYIAGMFPGFRECGGSPHNYQPDNNNFFTAAGTFALRSLLPKLNDEDKKITQQIIFNAQRTFPFFQNKDGFPFYNFWPTNSVIMPHTYYFKYLKSVFGEGEDADDAVMSLMATDANDSICNVLKKRMIETANLSRKKIISTYSKYKTIPAYGTYLGYKMTPDFDFGVHCNILYFMLDRKLPPVKQDSATIDILAQIIKNREYMKAPIYLSPYYVKSSVLIYHIARLIGRFKINEFEKYKPQLIADAKTELSKSTNIMDQIILCTSLLRLGANPSSLSISSLEDFEKSNQNKFIFFQARAAFSYPTPLKQIFLHWSYICYYFYCPSYNKILLLEYLLAKNQFLN
jgi:hypothetical protein